MADNVTKKGGEAVKTARKLPYNLEAEQCVLGCVLLDNDVAGEVLTGLKKDDFYSESHQSIFSAMTALYLKSTPIDFVTLTGQLEEERTLDTVGGIVYITELTNILPSAANYSYYMDIVKRDGTLRSLIKGANDIITKIYENPEAEFASNYAEKTIYDITSDKQMGTLRPIAEVSGKTLSEIEQRCISGDSLKGLKTGFKYFDAMTSGLQKSNLIVLAARPGVGKTAFALNIATNVALDPKINGKVAIFNLEMRGEELVQRMYCSVGKIKMNNIKSGQLTAPETKRLVETHKKLSEARIYIDDTASTNPMGILSKCRRIAQDSKLDLVIVDYLQLMSLGTKTESRQNEVSTMSRQMKLLARELDVPVILLSQMSRSIEKYDRKDKEPQLSDLRESGSIEQDADIVIFLSKDKEASNEDEELQVVDLHVAKQRNGSLGKIKLSFIGPEVRFETLSEAERDRMVKEKLAEAVESGESKQNSVEQAVSSVVEGFDYAKQFDEATDTIDGLVPPPDGFDLPPIDDL